MHRRFATSRLVGAGASILLLALVSATCADTPALTPSAVPVYTYKVRAAYPHDPTAFTQGLVYDGGFLYEGTGLYGRSTLRKVELKSGTVVKLRTLSPLLFGEGIAIIGGHIVQCTWRSHTAFVYDKHSFELLRTFSYPGECWGLTSDGERLIMSDGSSTLRFIDPQTFAELDRVDVFDASGAVTQLNELEYVRGEILANVWQSDRIARISAQSGKVLAWIDLTGLLAPDQQPVDVLNGIAYDAADDRLFVTGKLWPKLFEIKLVPPGR